MLPLIHVLTFLLLGLFLVYSAIIFKITLLINSKFKSCETEAIQMKGNFFVSSWDQTSGENVLLGNGQSWETVLSLGFCHHAFFDRFHVRALVSPFGRFHIRSFCLSILLWFSSFGRFNFRAFRLSLLLFFDRFSFRSFCLSIL